MKKTTKADKYFEVSALREDDASVSKVKGVFDEAIRVVLHKRENRGPKPWPCILL